MKLNIPQKKIEGFLRFLDFTRSHPHLSRVALRLAYKVPRLKMALPVSYRI